MHHNKNNVVVVVVLVVARTCIYVVHMLQQQLIHKWNIGIRLTLLPLIECIPIHYKPRPGN
jgi:hypothetical protein